MTKNNVLEVYDLLTKIGDEKSTIKFSYFVAKNKNILKLENDNIRETIKPTKEYQEYQKELDTLKIKYCKKDENGNPIVKDNMISFDEKDVQEFNKEVTETNTKFNEIIVKEIARTKELNDFLKETSEVIPYQISIENIPDNVFTSNEVALLVETNFIKE
jgi:hypothetical protein